MRHSLVTLALTAVFLAVPHFVAGAQGTGSISVTLIPEEAALAGAAWAVDGGEWQASGDIQDDSVPGPHTVSVKAVSYWKTPAAQAVTVYV
ncbi:MAG: hypothetical protein RBU21_23305, partial [FCB group bacterium]|nr:hypothetical protein [FCB group bacterium]